MFSREGSSWFRCYSEDSLVVTNVKAVMLIYNLMVVLSNAGESSAKEPAARRTTPILDLVTSLGSPTEKSEIIQHSQGRLRGSAGACAMVPYASGGDR